MAEIAQLMPNGEQTFVDANGVPLDGGSVTMYIPTTTTFKNTWQDEGETILNTNPIVLDAAGRCIIYGNGKDRQIVKDRLGNLQWDQLTNWVASSGGGGGGGGSFYDLAIFIQGKPTDAETYPIFNIARSLKLPTGLVGTVATVLTNPTATMTFTLFRNGISIGTIAFSTSGVPTITFVSDVTFNAGDQFTMVNQATADATGAFIAITLVFTVL
jgi:hypothetical protein